MTSLSLVVGYRSGLFVCCIEQSSAMSRRRFSRAMRALHLTLGLVNRGLFLFIISIKDIVTKNKTKHYSAD